MSQQIEHKEVDPEQRRTFVRNVLSDLRALERILNEDMIESDVRRIGVEQELVLVDANYRPASVAMEILERLDPDLFTTELALFNLEFNLPPLVFEGQCLSGLERMLTSALEEVERVAADFGARPILTGILPTLTKSDMGLDSIAPRARYHRLVNALRELRGEAYEFRIAGLDELVTRHESVMLEACNTSSQYHFQVAPHEFPALFNAAQAAAGPTLAVAVNSPLMFGQRLWHETRIAVFQQAIDTRRQPLLGIQQRSARVRFGEQWVRESVLELFREDVARFRVLLAEDVEEDSEAALDEGRIPKLRALQLHNGTVYRWNRACYGVTDGRPHLRIENRCLPSGPTIVDEVANAAFWFGAIAGLVEQYGDISRHMRFDIAQGNFMSAARLGLDAPICWLDGRSMSAAQAAENIFLPLAHDGLLEAGIDSGDVDRYLGIIEDRVRSRQTGASWLLDAFDKQPGHRTPTQRVRSATAAMGRRQREGRPVHEWTPMQEDEIGDFIQSYVRVDQVMTTDVFTVRDDDLVDLAASLMDWKHIRHVPVENEARELVGLVSYRQLLRVLARESRSEPIMMREIMHRDPVTITPETTSLEALDLMRRRKVPCLPVVSGDRLVGILTERDFLLVAAHLLEERLRAES